MKKFRHYFCPSETISKYNLIVFDDLNEPFIPLTEYYHYLLNRVSDGTALTYINVLERFFSWLKHKSLVLGNRCSWNDEPVNIQSAIKQYLVKEMQCRVRDQNSYEKVFLTSKSQKSVNLFLSAINGFYKAMIHLNMYLHYNPLINCDWQDDFVEFSGERKNKPRMPDIAGTEEPNPMKYRKQTNTYFKIMNDEWTPEIIGDVDLPYKIYSSGEKLNWKTRDEVITRILFETGARISEILGLTMGDYRKRTDKHELSAFNKGSYKRRSKYIKISPETLKLFIRYINQERILYAKNPAKFDFIANEEIIFLSERGTSYSYSAFYKNWCKIVSNAGLKLNPHKARHWFVTSMLRGIYETSKSPTEIEEQKKQLIIYMKWRDSETINIYEHYFDEHKYSIIHDHLIGSYREREQNYLKTRKSNSLASKVTADKTQPKTSLIEQEEWLNEFISGMRD